MHWKMKQTKTHEISILNFTLISTDSHLPQIWKYLCLESYITSTLILEQHIEIIEYLFMFSKNEQQIDYLLDVDGSGFRFERH